MKLITRDTDYALRAVCSIASNGKRLSSVSSLSGELNIPRPFLRKLLQVLHSRGVLNSLKGRGGGFSLAKAAKEIFLWDIMQIFQGRFCLNECFLRKKVCPNINKCILRKKIKRIENYVSRELKGIKIDSLLSGQKNI